MRNLLDTSSVAQSLDGDRLTGSLHFPDVAVDVINSSAARMQDKESIGEHAVRLSLLHHLLAVGVQSVVDDPFGGV
jgi:hypothetical protein